MSYKLAENQNFVTLTDRRPNHVGNIFQFPGLSLIFRFNHLRMVRNLPKLGKPPEQGEPLASYATYIQITDNFVPIIVSHLLVSLFLVGGHGRILDLYQLFG